MRRPSAAEPNRCTGGCGGGTWRWALCVCVFVCLPLVCICVVFCPLSEKFSILKGLCLMGLISPTDEDDYCLGCGRSPAHHHQWVWDQPPWHGLKWPNVLNFTVKVLSVSFFSFSTGDPAISLVSEEEEDRGEPSSSSLLLPPLPHFLSSAHSPPLLLGGASQPPITLPSISPCTLKGLTLTCP